MTERVLVLGVGNSLMGDDGVGAAVVDRLVAAGLPERARAVSVPDVYALPQVWNSEPQVWLVDAMIRDGEPGTIYRLSHEEVVSLPGDTATAHHLALGEAVRWIRHTFPRMAALSLRLWGVEPARVAPPEGLTEAVTAAARSISDELLGELVDSRQFTCD